MKKSEKVFSINAAFYRDIPATSPKQQAEDESDSDDGCDSGDDDVIETTRELESEEEDDTKQTDDEEDVPFKVSRSGRVAGSWNLHRYLGKCIQVHSTFNKSNGIKVHNRI